MHFPVYLRVGTITLHPHWVFEVLAYFVAVFVYLALRRKRGDVLDIEARWWVVASMAAGAAVGSKILFWFEDPHATAAHWHDPQYLLQGKTIVGALIGGLIAVEWAKHRLGITQRTGDLLALPIIVGTAIGRIGCFLTGNEDQTSGLPTSLPWGVDFGDGPRHPTQLYEIFFLIILGALIVWLSHRQPQQGSLFRSFIVGYLGFRVVVDSIKPELRVFGGLSSIQWACLLTLAYIVYDWRRDSLLPLPTSVCTREDGENLEMKTRTIGAYR